MTSLQDFLNHMDWTGLISLLISAVAALFCITFHEVSHGVMAYCLGDPTAKQAGRLTLQPLRHIDPLGLVMLLVAKVGWAKPVPVDMRNFRHPRRDMALTALAGPLSNFLLAIAALIGSSLIYHFSSWNRISFLLLCLFSNAAILSTGLGLFNLIPISPLDGSKVLFAFLPDRFYAKILHYERYIMILVVILTMAGVFQKPLSWLILFTLEKLCILTNYPLSALLLTQDFASLTAFLH